MLLDGGADIRADADDLVKYAVMGASYARNALGLTRPRVGLLNVGTEEHKGRSELHEAAERMAAVGPASDFEYIGYVEGSDMPSDRVDVIVTDGFTGNVALKTGEGTARMIQGLLREAFAYSALSRIGALFALTSLKRLQKRIDPRRANGGVFLGLNGTVIKSHGSADATGVSAAIKLAFTLAEHGFTSRLAARVGASEPPPTRRSGGCRHERRCARCRAAAATICRRGWSRTPSSPQTLDTSDEWIRTRTGIERRHFAAEGELTSDLAIAAARAALADGGLTGADIDALIVATATPDQTFPSAAVKVQSAIGMRGGFAFDIQAVCAGFVFALAQADALIRGGAARRVMVIGAETFSRILDFQDRSTCVLFGDGAGALILEAAEGAGTSEDRGILATDLHSDGRYAELLYVDGGPSSTGTAGVVRMAGQEVFKHAVVKLAQTGAAALERAGLAHLRRRLAGAAPGEPPDHDDDRAQARGVDGPGGGDGAGPRQHLGRVDSPGAVGRARRGPHPARRRAAHGGDRRRACLGRGGSALVSASPLLRRSPCY